MSNIDNFVMVSHIDRTFIFLFFFHCNAVFLKPIPFGMWCQKNDVLPAVPAGFPLGLTRAAAQNNVLWVFGKSFLPWCAMYFRMVSSFIPIVETKYPTLQMLPSRYISRMNLNFFLRMKLESILSTCTTAATARLGGISIWRWTWSSSVLTEYRWSVGYFLTVVKRLSTNSSFTYGLRYLYLYLVPQMMWYCVWYMLWLRLRTLMSQAYHAFA